MFKMGPVARKLKIGFESFKIINQPKTDVNLRFSSNNMQRLAALLNLAEQDDFLLLWKPQAPSRPRFTLGGILPAKTASANADADFAAAPETFTIKSSSSNARDSLDVVVPVGRHGAELSDAAAESVRKMREIPVEWRTFHINLGAYLYCSMFKMPIPKEVMPISKPEVVRWLHIKPEDSNVRHRFVLYK
jgi:hypothetical protein